MLKQYAANAAVIHNTKWTTKLTDNCLAHHHERGWKAGADGKCMLLRGNWTLRIFFKSLSFQMESASPCLLTTNSTLTALLSVLIFI